MLHRLFAHEHRHHFAPHAQRGRMVHVFPHGRMCSLRRALMLWLVPLFVIVGVVCAVLAYWSYNKMVGEFMDDQMLQLGNSVALQEERVAPPVPTAERIHKMGAYVVQVFDTDGTKIVDNWPKVAVPLQAAGFHDVQAAGESWRVFATDGAANGGRRVQVVQSLTFRQHVAFEHVGSAIAPLVVLLPLAILTLWGVARMMSRAVQDIGRQAALQDENSIEELPLDRVPQEIRPLVVSFNSLLTRLRDAFTTQRRFVQDAAHELRTPITAVALQLENVVRDMPPNACQQSMAQLQAGVWRAQRLVDQLLKLSRQEAHVAEAPTLVDLRAQVHESMNALIALADQRNIDLGLVADDGPAPAAIKCAPGDLRSVIDNLIENALRYTPEGGVVDVRVVHDGKPAVEVVDTGPGIPQELLGRVFDRFFRVPGSAARGSGLGLAIAQAAAQRCGMRITLRNRDDRSGLVARVELA